MTKKPPGHVAFFLDYVLFFVGFASAWENSKEAQNESVYYNVVSQHRVLCRRDIYFGQGCGKVIFDNTIKASKALSGLTEEEKYYLGLVFLAMTMSSVIFFNWNL